VEEVFDFSQDDLEHDDVFILDTYTAVFIWIGKHANATEAAKAEDTAGKYVQAQARLDGRPVDCPATVVKAGHEVMPFTVHFIGWSEEKGQEFEDPYEKRKRLLMDLSAGPAVHSAAIAKLRPENGGAAGNITGAIMSSAVSSALSTEVGPTAPTLRGAPPQSDAGFLNSLGGMLGGLFSSQAPRQGESARMPPSPPDAAAGVKRAAVAPLDLGQLAKLDRMATSDQMDSARRRALAAGKTVDAMGGGQINFADPGTERFSLEEIATNRTNRPLNPVCRELYLQEIDFKRVFGMAKEDFYAMKLWKQRELKKKMGLF